MVYNVIIYLHLSSFNENQSTLIDITQFFNATISWQSVLLVKETGVPGENHKPAASHWQTLKIKWRLTIQVSGYMLHGASGLNAITLTLTQIFRRNC
jgi:hypothetical protein